MENDRRSQAENLMDEGYKAIKNDDSCKAIAIGKRLTTLRHSSGFEILALAYAAQGKRGLARRTLERGVSKAPSVWLLWNLLGNYYSDSLRYSDALRAYQHALRCPKNDASFIHLNRAVVFDRQGKRSQALRVLDKVTNPSLELAATVFRVKLLNARGRFRQAILIATRTIKRPPTQDSWTTDWRTSGRDRPAHLAELHARLGEALWKQTGRKRKALNFAWEAIELDRSCSHALWLIREIENKKSPQAVYYRVLVQGVWPWRIPNHKTCAGFFAKFDVVADDVTEATQFLIRFLPVKARKSAVIEECRLVERRPNGPKGVYSTTGFILFPTKMSVRRKS